MFELFIDAGASSAEATCLAVRLARGVDEVSEVFTVEHLGAHDTPADALADAGADCIDRDRSEELAPGLERAFEREATEAIDAAGSQMVSRATLVGDLVAAGAEPAEAECTVSEVADVDLWFPSEDFNGDQAAVTTGDLFAEQASECGSVDHLREVARLLHAGYEEPVCLPL